MQSNRSPSLQRERRSGVVILCSRRNPLWARHSLALVPNCARQKGIFVKTAPERSKIEAWQDGVISTAPATDHTPERDRNMAPSIIAVPVIAANSALDSGSCVQSLKGANTMNEHATPRPRGSGSIYQNGSASGGSSFMCAAYAPREQPFVRPQGRRKACSSADSPKSKRKPTSHEPT